MTILVTFALLNYFLINEFFLTTRSFFHELKEIQQRSTCPPWHPLPTSHFLICLYALCPWATMQRWCLSPTHRLGPSVHVIAIWHNYCQCFHGLHCCTATCHMVCTVAQARITWSALLHSHVSHGLHYYTATCHNQIIRQPNTAIISVLLYLKNNYK